MPGGEEGGDEGGGGNVWEVQPIRIAPRHELHSTVPWAKGVRGVLLVQESIHVRGLRSVWIPAEEGSGTLCDFIIFRLIFDFHPLVQAPLPRPGKFI